MTHVLGGANPSPAVLDAIKSKRAAPSASGHNAAA
jgi:hypothetical protein